MRAPDMIRTESRRPCRRACRRRRPSRACAPRTAARAEVVAAAAAAKILAAARAAARVEHGQRGVEALQHHLGRIFLDAVLVGVLAGLELALEIDLGALLQILLDDFAEPFVEDHHAVPLGLFLALAGGLVAPAFRSGDRQVGDRTPVLGAPDFRIAAEIADEDHLVDRTCHGSLQPPLDRRPPVRTIRALT